MLLSTVTIRTSGLCWFLLLCLLIPVELLEWYELPPARRTLSLLDEVLQFEGNSSSDNGFKVMLQHGDNLLIGARNGMRRISLIDFTENMFLEWAASKDDEEMCKLKGRSNEECQNFIKVLEETEDGGVILCGTNAFKPKCRLYREKNDTSYYVEQAWDGKGLCPYDPYQSSTTLYSDKFLYAGTMADFSGNDPVIQRHPQPLRTERYDLKQLNDPSFVSSVEYGGYIYLFFRETAVEHINCGKVRYSRVGRVCKQDHGGNHNYQMRWTTFLKARLNCSNADKFPFYFNEIQSTSEVIESSDGLDVVYAVLSTPTSAVPGSAVCSFSMHDIIKSFDGPFKDQRDMNANWLPVPDNEVPTPRPGSCVNNSKDLTDHSLNFVKEHTLMDKAVPSRRHQPLVTTASTRYRFTQLVVDGAVPASDGSRHDVLFVGTDDGRVLKMIHLNSSIVILEDLQVLPVGVRVNAMKMASLPDGIKQLIILSEELVVSLPLHRCARKDVQSCRSCVALRDPYCVWNIEESECEELDYVFSNSSEAVQNVTTGKSSLCEEEREEAPTASSAVHLSSECDCSPHEDKGEWPETKRDKSTGENLIPDIITYNYMQDKVPKDYSHYPSEGSDVGEEGPQYETSTKSTKVYSQKILLISLCAGCAGTLVLGFAFGWICASRCKGKRKRRPYLEQPRPITNKNTYETKVINQTSEPNNKPSNVKMNVPEKNLNQNMNPEPNTPGKVNKTYV